MINGAGIKKGDRLVGLRSSGVHSNGYSLVRKLFPVDDKATFEYSEALGGVPAEVLLTPTRIYVKTVLALIEKVKIMGGGFIENIPRILPVGLAAKIDRNSYELPPLFKELQKRADISYEKMCNTFNMGIGMVLAVDRNDEEAAIKELRTLGEDPVRLGEVVEGEGVIL